jgi:DUF4097 and DUF4098 domain-containing protein YvlB
MSEQETYDRTLDAPAGELAAVQAPAMPAPTVPDEDYYRRPAPPRAGRRAALGLALVVVGLILLAVQVFGGPAIGGGTTKLVDETHPGSRIELSTTSADVEVRTWDEPTIRVQAIQRGGSADDFQVDVTNSGDTVRVSESGRNNFWCLFCSRDLRYEISVPSGAQADIRTASGDIDVEGLGGPIALGTVSGDVRADELSGDLTVETTSGEVRLSDVSGSLQVGTISGDVRLEDGQVNGAVVNTTSGEIELDGISGKIDLSTVSADITVSEGRDGRLKLETTSGEIAYDGSLASDGTNQVSSISGDVKLRLPEDSPFQLDASSVSGDISSEFDLTGGGTGRRSLSGTANGGGPALTVSTTSGEIDISKR